MTKILSQQKQRHRARRLAVQALYQWNYNHISAADLVATMLEDQGETKLDRLYFDELVQGVIKTMDQLDGALAPLLDRKLSELNPVELAILRLSAFEMLHKLEIPYRVVINEGVELAKAFGADQGHKYINAVLDNLVKQIKIRSNEIHKRN